MKNKLGWSLSFSAFMAITVMGAEPGTIPLEEHSIELPPAHFFSAGHWEATLSSGVMFSPALVDPERPTVNYTLSELQIGHMLSDVKEWGWFRGNFEVAAKAFGGGIFDGPGSYMLGGGFGLRYNFVQSGWRVIPFAQLGGAVMSTDTSRQLIGQDFNFNIDIGAGFRYLFSPNWSVSFEYRFQHISNAKLAKHDIGINAHGPMIGLSRFF